MSFKEEMVSNFSSSMGFLIESMLETLTYISRGNIMENKPSYTVQTEKFFSFYEKIASSSEKDKQTLLENLKQKVVGPVYDKYSLNFLNKLVSDEGKVEDSFIKVPASASGDSLKIRTTPGGIYFQISKVFLPISEVYTEAVKVSLQHKGENLPFPNKILLGLYSVIFHSVKDRLDRDTSNYFTENIKTLNESLEVCDEVKEKPTDQGPMGLIKNMLGNIDFNQIGDMMAKVSGDEKSSKEFSDVFGKLSESIKNGSNPLEVMGDIIKQATVEAAEHEEQEEVPAQGQGEETEVKEEVPVHGQGEETDVKEEVPIRGQGEETEDLIDGMVLPESGL